MKGIIIKSSGAHSLIQDKGRYGFRKFGMPVSGVMDSNSHALANWLVGNQPDEALIEITLSGPEIGFLSKSMFAVTGAEADIFLNGKTVSRWKSLIAKKGDILSFGKIHSGLRCYIAFAGGFRLDDVLGSKSTYVRAGVGGNNGKALKKGNILALYPAPLLFYKKKKVPEKLIPEFSNNICLRVTKGLDHKSFDKESIRTFLKESFTVAANSDRMGLRLDGPEIIRKDAHEIISYPIEYGVIQVPSNGLPIIMAADCQTTGGYPQIAKVISADLPALGQVRPGSRITFSMLTIDEAVEIYRKTQESLKEILSSGKSRVCTDCFEKR